MTPLLHAKTCLWLGVGFLTLGLLVSIALLGQHCQQVDHALLRACADIRLPWLTAAAADATALGSFTVGALVSTVAIVLFWFGQYRREALQILVSFAGATLWLHLLKNIIQRPRPDEISSLVHTAGFSYPSGHSLTAASLYLTLAIVGTRLLTARKARVAVTSLAIFIILLVGLSRIYLGAHYPSDVAVGLFFGAGWSLLGAAGFARAPYGHLLPSAHQAKPDKNQ